MASWEVPPNVTLIAYTVIGGGGGGRTDGESSFNGGAGALVTGQLHVTPGTTLVLVVGAGGVNAGSSTGGSNQGGDGYGAGGPSGPLPNVPDFLTGGSGGGGSAIVSGPTPVVLAGGGGGGGMGVAEPTAGAADISPATSWFTRPRGAPSAQSAGDAELRWDPPPPAGTWVVMVQGGQGVAGAGAGGLVSAGFVTAPTRTLSPASGVNGGVVTPGGARGGRGAQSSFLGFTDGSVTIAGGGASAGGGGGGHIGGGGGAATGATWSTAQGAPQGAGMAVGAGGGGGSSFVTPAAIGSIVPVPGSSSIGVATNGGTTTGTRLPGSIVLTYCIP